MMKKTLLATAFLIPIASLLVTGCGKKPLRLEPPQEAIQEGASYYPRTFPKPTPIPGEGLQHGDKPVTTVNEENDAQKTQDPFTTPLKPENPWTTSYPEDQEDNTGAVF